jgi:probable HAF family extracellular repeat protein
VAGIDSTSASFIAQIGQPRVALGSAPDGSSAMATALNANGEVVGYSQSAQGRAALHYAGGSWTLVPGLSGAWSVAVAIDGSGRIVGMGASGSGMQGFLVAGGAAQDLQLAVPNSAVYGIAPDNRVMGMFQTAKGETHAFWSADAGVIDLGTFGGANSMPYGMNNHGDVVGAAETAAGPRHAFVAWTGTATLIDLGVTGGTSSEARGISNQGQIAGNIYDAKHVSRPVVFVAGQNPIELLPTDSTSPYFSAHVVAMSPAGNIVGWGLPGSADGGASPNGSGAHCLLWTPGGA